MSAELVPLIPEAVTPMGVAAITPMQMLSMAVSQNADLDKLTKLMDLQERWEKNEARKAYVEAMALFKLNPPKLVKDKAVAFKDTKYRHAELDQVAGKIGAGLAQYGLSHSWSPKQENGLISVTCTITHTLGHSESVTLSAPPDASGAKNSVQQVGSTITYLERYTLQAITGLATSEDDDASALHDPDILDIHSAKDLQSLKDTYARTYKAAQSRNDTKALARIVAAYQARKKELM